MSLCLSVCICFFLTFEESCKSASAQFEGHCILTWCWTLSQTLFMTVKLSKAIKKKKIHHPFSDRYDNLCLFKSTMINSFTVMVFVRSEQQNILNVYIPITWWQLGGNPLCISHASSLTLTDMLPLRNNNVTCHSQAGQKHSGNLIWWTCQNIIQKEN